MLHAGTARSTAATAQYVRKLGRPAWLTGHCSPNNTFGLTLYPRYSSVAIALQDLVTTGRLQPDQSQTLAAEVLSALQTSIRQKFDSQQQSTPQRTSDVEAQRLSQTPPDPAPATNPSGAYLWGTVGSGKTMLLELFCSSFADTDWQQQGICRLHFHEFMLKVHSQLHKLQESVPRITGHSQFGLPVYRQEHYLHLVKNPTLLCATIATAYIRNLLRTLCMNFKPEPGLFGNAFSCCNRYAPLQGHPVDIVAQSIAKSATVLCLDELHVADVAEALILGQVKPTRFCHYTNIPWQIILSQGLYSYQAEQCCAAIHESAATRQLCGVHLQQEAIRPLQRWPQQALLSALHQASTEATGSC